MNTLEQEMKAFLDGWFFSIDHERGRTISTDVPVDFIPDHRPKYMPEDEECRNNNNAHRWTEVEDQTLLDMRRQGHTFREIGKALGLSGSPVQGRYALLCTKLGLRRVSAVRTESMKHSMELEARIVEMRIKGMGFPEIGDRVGLPREIVNAIFRRYRDRCKRMERMA